MSAGARGIVCAKVSEAEPFADAGITDICIAYPVFGDAKWARVASLARRGVRVTVNCDSAEAACGLSKAAVAQDVRINLQIDIDTGLHRGGIPISDVPSIERLAGTIMALPGVMFDGLTTFRSVSYGGSQSAEESGREEGRLMVEVAQKLRSRGIDVREVTAGSTPTGKWIAEVEGITESRAGTYVFNDLMQVEAGAATTSQLAVSVLCTVVSRDGSRLTLDAGSKTFSPEASVTQDGKRSTFASALEYPVVVERLSEEHGIARVEGVSSPKLGDRIRMIPHHVCTCVNLTDQLVGIRGDRVEVVWPVVARGLRE
jgi:D-serine deaminase-like pyridoxal phosphate-dependent protein